MSDLTRGPVLTAIVRFGLPLGAANLAQQGYLLVDSVIVGRYTGVTGLAAVGAGQPLFALMTGVFFGAATAFSVRLGGRLGAGAGPGRAAAGALAAVTAGWSAACLLLTVALTGPVLHLLGVEGAVAAGARRFLLVLAAGLPAVFGLGAVTAAQRGLGDARSALRVTVLTSVLNAALAWWFVGPLGWGVTGAAAATGVANLFGLAAGLAQLRRRWPAAGAAEPGGVGAELRAALGLGLPLAGQQALIGLGVLVLVLIVARYGTVALAAVTVVARLELFTGLLFANLSGALTVFVAQNHGAGRADRVGDGLRRTLWLTVALTAAVTAALLVRPSAVAAAFGGDGATQAVIARYIVVAYPFFVLYTAMVVTHGWLIGLGRTGPPLVCTVVSFVAVRLPLTYLLGRWHGVDGILWAVVVSWAVGAAYTALVVRAPAPAVAAAE
ncbi:MATE family efflux transporter [Dactylosporangium sp. CA-092794]|uniref:MATE family efflux transporter n=1 Tax=Dactylosporangium sp. CA-092794 TaxID=3239929 RepID=UPI003D8E94AE